MRATEISPSSGQDAPHQVNRHFYCGWIRIRTVAQLHTWRRGHKVCADCGYGGYVGSIGEGLATIVGCKLKPASHLAGFARPFMYGCACVIPPLYAHTLPQHNKMHGGVGVASSKTDVTSTPIIIYYCICSNRSRLQIDAGPV